ncbi:hypothetical protein EYF80_035505 [Liparis tanakae]|uniref:Uncharacterized protein n=1 Tax=Liparis tanakae TaxID=230148 RepID=A0A4Z2GL70_9TELE|nr:hypothetical protein EYF80_035505 [Liparis tanakae]
MSTSYLTARETPQDTEGVDQRSIHTRCRCSRRLALSITLLITHFTPISSSGRVEGFVVIRLNRNLKDRVQTRENHVLQSRVSVQNQPISCSQRVFSL